MAGSVNVRAILVGGVVSVVGSSILAWFVAQSSITATIREGLTADKVSVESLRQGQEVLRESDKQFVTRAEFDQFLSAYRDHWKEQHDFQVRMDQEMLEVMKQHAQMTQQAGGDIPEMASHRQGRGRP